MHVILTKIAWAETFDSPRWKAGCRRFAFFVSSWQPRWQKPLFKGAAFVGVFLKLICQATWKFYRKTLIGPSIWISMCKRLRQGQWIKDNGSSSQNSVNMLIVWPILGRSTHRAKFTFLNICLAHLADYRPKYCAMIMLPPLLRPCLWPLSLKRIVLARTLLRTLLKYARSCQPIAFGILDDAIFPFRYSCMAEIPRLVLHPSWTDTLEILIFDTIEIRVMLLIPVLSLCLHMLFLLEIFLKVWEL